MRPTYVLALIGTVVLSACGSSSHPTGATTVAPTTAAPTATATSVAMDMIRSGVPASLAFTYTAENDPSNVLGQKGGYTSKVRLQDHRLPTVSDFTSQSADPTGGGAAIECYPNNSGAKQRYETLTTFSGGLLRDGYDYASGPCVLRLDKALTKSEAAQYQQAFQAASK